MRDKHNHPHRKLHRHCALYAAMLGTAIAIPGQVMAQGAQGRLEEIVVTAQRRAENLQEVPIAVSAITGDSLRNSGVEVSRDLPQVVPSVQFTRSGPSGLFFIRGVGTTNAAAGEEGANAFYVDDVYLGDLSQTINEFNNIERIEVLKGPQGTLFGRNATGGLVHIITREPTDETVVSGEVGYGNYNTFNAKLYVAGPLTDNVKADLALTAKDQKDGWGRNLTLDRDNKVQEFWGARSKVVIEPNDTVKLTLSGDYFDNEDNIGLAWKLDPGTVGTGGFTGPGGHDTTANEYSLTDLEIWGLGFKAEVDLGFADFTSLSAYRKTDNHSFFDVDGGPLDLIKIVYDSGLESFQQEFRLASTDTENLSWQVGAFYLHSKVENESSFLGGAFTGQGVERQAIEAELTTDSYALFGEATYSFTPATQLTAGVRYTEDRRDFDASQFNILLNGMVFPGGAVSVPSGKPLATPGVQKSKLEYEEVTWRVALRHEINDDVNVYASVNRGFKAGSYSLQNPLNDPYQPQEILAYEIGLKSELLDNRLRLNVSAYHYDIDDYQVRSAAVANPGASLVLNAATVEVDGVDIEFEAAPTDMLRIFGGATYLDSRFDKFGGPGAEQQAPIAYPVYIPGQTVANSCLPASVGSRNPGLITGTTPIGGTVSCLGNVSGNHTPNAPHLTASLGASYLIPTSDGGEFRLSALYSYNSGYYFESDNIAEQKSYNLLNAAVEYRPKPNLGIEIWGRNLTDEEYAVQKITTATGVAATLGAPRTYGITLKFDY